MTWYINRLNSRGLHNIIALELLNVWTRFFDDRQARSKTETGKGIMRGWERGNERSFSSFSLFSFYCCCRCCCCFLFWFVSLFRSLGCSVICRSYVTFITPPSSIFESTTPHFRWSCMMHSDMMNGIGSWRSVMMSKFCWCEGCVSWGLLPGVCSISLFLQLDFPLCCSGLSFPLPKSPLSIFFLISFPFLLFFIFLCSLSPRPSPLPFLLCVLGLDVW